MSNTLLAFSNALQTSTLKSGTGGGAPARSETSPYTMEKALNADRYTYWRSAAAPASPVQFDIDLGSSNNITVAALLGLRAAPGAIVGCTVYSQAGGTYTPGGTWTSRGSISTVLGPRDTGVTFGSVSARFWRFEFSVTTAFQLGRLWLSTYTDLGGQHSPGARTSPRRNRIEQPMPGGGVLIEDTGDKGHSFTIPWNTASTSVRSSLELISDAPGSFLMIDPEGRFFEVFAPGGLVDVARAYQYQVGVQLERLP